MKQRYKLFGGIFMLVLVFLLFGIDKVYSQKLSASNVKTQTGSEYIMPDFELVDQYGNTHRLSEYRGKIVFVNFWATWCKYCVEELPDLQKIYEERGKNQDDVVILGIVAPKTDINPSNVDKDVKFVKNFIEKKKVTYPILFDESGENFAEYGIRFFPTSFVIDRDGKLFEFIGGATHKDKLDSILNKALESK